jgi:crotonobetainyl-CoA:carnitine CoA-transferase CaiB-like acyl-CoA transferase
MLGVPELKTDPRFQERDTRKGNRFLLNPLLEEKLVQQPTAYWVEVLNARGIPSGDVVSLEAALTSEQAKHRQVIEEIDQPGIGKVKIFNLTAKFSKTPAQIEMPPPRLSEHTESILIELGYSDEDVKALRLRKVI